MMDASAAIRLVQISDTHLSRKRAYFMDNWELLVGGLAAARPELIVSSGDLSFDGAGDEDDLAFSRQEHDRLPAPWIAIPGNHDSGESQLALRNKQPIDDERIARWRRHIGPQWWVRDIGAWRLVGIDTALLGSDRPEEGEQRRFLEAALAGRGGRPVILFQHMPPYLTEAGDERQTALAVPFPVRGLYLDLAAAGGVRVIACGHVHIYRHLQHRGMDIVWAPPTSFVNIVDQQKAGRGVPRPGYIEWTLEGQTARHRLVEPPLMIAHDVGRWNEAVGSTTKFPPRPWRGRAPV